MHFESLKCYVPTFTFAIWISTMKRGPPTAPPPQPQLLARKKEHIGRQLISLPERFWEWVVDTVDVNHDELLAFFSFAAVVLLNALSAIMMFDYDNQRQLIFLGILLSISIINTYIFFSKTKSYQLFQPNVAQLQNRTNVDVIKIATGEESEKHVWVLHTWNRTQFSAVVFKWFSPLSVLLWYAGRDEILGVQVIFFVCVLFAGWQLSKLADAYEVALEDSKLIAAELFVEGEQAALRHFSRTKKDAGSQTESLYSRGLPSSSRMNLPHARPTPPAAAMSTLYRNANASNSARDFSSSPSPPPPATPLQSYERESNGWGVASPAYSALPVRPMPLNPGMRTSPVMQDNFSSYTSPALHAASQYTPPRDSFMRATPPPATQSPDSMDIDTDYLSSNGNGGASFMQPAPAHRYVDVGLPPAVPSYGGVERTPPRPTNRFSAISPISPASPVLSPPPPTSIQHDLPPTTSLNGF